MNKVVTIIIYLVIISVVSNRDAYPWAEETHKNLTQYAVDNSVLSKHKNNYLKFLGFDNGLEEYLEWDGNRKKLDKWLEQGAAFEDSGSTWDMLTLNARFFNHFHDPTKSWDTAGLDDWIILPPYHVTGQSSLLWAQDGVKQESSPAGDWSWMIIREDFYIALTGKAFDGSIKAMTEQERNQYYAQMFRGLGHQMHLVQDAAIPEHVRNDAHPEDALGLLPYSIGFEKWAGENRSRIDSFASDPIFPDMSSLNPSQMMLDPSYQSRGLSPSALFIDTDQYNGSNPSTSLSVGLAEYTNANFFSYDTIFAAERYSQGNRHFFPYPKDSSTNLQELVSENPDLVRIITGEDNVQDTVFSIKKDKDGEQIDHFLRMGYFGGNASIKNAPGDVYWRTFYRDEECHEDYAEKLVPRAVGYSAKLLDYFFRGDIHLVEDGGAINTYMIKNNSSEDMDGTFELYYDGTLDQNGNPGLNGELFRKPLTYSQAHPVSPGQPVTWQGQIPAGEKGGLLEIDNFPIDFPEDEYGEVFLVFRGTMGEEYNYAVAGREDNITYLGPLGYYVRGQSSEYTGLTDGSFSSCDNNDPPFGELTGYDQLLHVYQKKFSNGTESFYLIKEQYLMLDTVGHKVVIYNPDSGMFDTLIAYNDSQDASFNASEDLQNIYVAIQGEFILVGYKYMKNGNNWVLDTTNSWSTKLGYVKKDGTIVATRWQDGEKEKVHLDIETGSLTAVNSNLYSETNSIVDGSYTPEGTQCGLDTYSCRFNVTIYQYYCGKTCDAYNGTRGDVNSTVQNEDFLYYRSGGTGDYIEDMKTRKITSSMTYMNNYSNHVDCSEMADDRCGRSSDWRSDINCDLGTVTDFWNSRQSSNTTYNRNSSGATYDELIITCGTNCFTWGENSTSNHNAYCNWNSFSGGTTVSVLWTGKDYWKFIVNSSSSRTRNGGDPVSCPNPSCGSGGNFRQWFNQYELGSETSSVSYSIDIPYGSIDFGSLPPDQFVFFYLEDAYENNYIEGLKYHHNGTWHLKLYMNGKPFDLLGCTGSTAEEFQFPILLQ